MDPNDPGAGGGGPPPFDELYDDRELAAMEARRQPWAPPGADRGEARPRLGGAPTAPGATVGGVRRGIGSAALAVGLVGGLRDVFEPPEDHEIAVEVDRLEPFADRPLSFVLVPGNPRASRIVLRPWLAAAG